MASDEIEKLLVEVGQLLAEDTDYPLDGTLLYAELDDNFVEPSIFKDLGNHILYRLPDLHRLGGCLIDLWEAEEPAKRWTEIEYVIRDGKFDATFTFADDIDPEKDPMERRDQVVRRHFGDKPIVYPPLPGREAVRYDL